MKLKPSGNGKITLSFTVICISCPSHKFLTSQICLLMLFVKIKFSRTFLNSQYDLMHDVETIMFGLCKQLKFIWELCLKYR